MVPRDLQSFIVPIILLYLFLEDIVISEKAFHVDYEKSCTLAHCGHGEHCVSRKFWCKNPPCPSMLYCSRTPRESIKGPMTCASVRCSKGYICMVRVRRCRWDRRCKQQIARCVSEREYYEGPASCADFHCPSGHRCILRESLCAYPPCKLLKSCANVKDVQVWHDRCRTLGCPSEYECFLRRPSDDCQSANSCKHKPDCVITDVQDLAMNPECQGWVCPRDKKCSAVLPESCSSDDGVESCKVNRTCHGPLATLNTAASQSARLISRVASNATNISDGTWQRGNYEPFLIPTETYHQESNHRPGHPTKQTTATIVEVGNTPTPSQTDCNLSKRTVRIDWEMRFEKWNLQNGSLYRAPVYVRSTVNRSSDEAGKSTSEERPTDHSTTQWLDHLRLKTGVDAINVWIKQAEENRKYKQFNEWLSAVKTNLGPFRFENWLTEIRKLTSEYPAFQKWLVTNEPPLSLAENHTDNGNGNGNGTDKKSLVVFPDQELKPEVENEQIHEATESPVHGYGKLTDFYPGLTSGNDRLVFSVNQKTSNVPLRKNSGYPRINYRRNRGHKQHREFYQPEFKTEMPTVYKINDPPSRLQTQQDNETDTKIGYFDLPELLKKLENDPGLDHPINHSLQLDLKNDENDEPSVELSNQRNSTVRNDSRLHSPVDKLQKTTWNDSRVRENAQENNFEDPLSNVVVRRQEERNNLMNEKNEGQVPIGLGYFKPESRDEIRDDNGVDHDVLFTKVEDPKWNSGPQRTPVSSVSRQFVREDQRESPLALGFPESINRQYYQRVHELDHRIPEGITKPGNSSSADIETKKNKDMTKSYTLASPAPDEIHIISPWDAVRVLDPKQKAYYPLVGFAPGQGNNRLRIIGYPLVVSRVSSIDQANVFPRDAKGLVDISPDAETNANLNPWNQIYQHQTIPRLLVSPVRQNSDHSIIGEPKQPIDFISQQQLQHQDENSQRSSVNLKKHRPMLSPVENLYPWDGRTQLHLPQATHASELPVKSHSTGSTDLEESLMDHRDALRSQEYVDAYVNALIEDALSRVILSEQLKDDEDRDIRLRTTNRFDEGNLDTVKETQYPNKKILADEDRDSDMIISDILQAVNSTKYVLASENRMITTPTENSSPDLTIGEIDYQYGCGDGDKGLSGPMETEEKNSALDEVEDFYYDDTEQQEYFEGSSRYEDEYLGELETNSTAYNFEYYVDEDYGKVLQSEEIN